MDSSKNNQKEIEELQLLEQHLHNFLAQKQVFQVEQQEITNALDEVKKTKDDVYRVLTGILLKAEKESLIKELEEKKKVVELRISAIEKQEQLIEDKAKKMRAKVSSAIQKN